MDEELTVYVHLNSVSIEISKLGCMSVTMFLELYSISANFLNYDTSLPIFWGA